MKLRCRVFGHDTYSWRHVQILSRDTVLGSGCRRCGKRWVTAEIPAEGLHFMVLPKEER